jgi:hypothetical protein
VTGDPREPRQVIKDAFERAFSEPAPSREESLYRALTKATEALRWAFIRHGDVETMSAYDEAFAAILVVDVRRERGQ